MANTGKIEFCDLAAQQGRIRAGVEAAIARVLDHGQYIMGPEVTALEAGLAMFCGARHAIACASGADALLIAMMAKGIGPGDAILCPGFTTIATPEAITRLGATPVFVDVDPVTFNIDPEGLTAAIRLARAHKLKPKGLIAADLFGMPADYGAIRAFAVMEGLFILADATQSLGASYRGRKTGALGDVTATSFFPTRPLGCYGDGGAIFTDDTALAEVMGSIRQHGRGAEKYDIVRIGLNGRLDTIQAAILIEKLRVFPAEIDARNAVAANYGAALAGVAGVPLAPAGSRSVWAHYTITLPLGRRDAVRQRLAADGIPTQVHFPRALHNQPAYRHFPAAYDPARSHAGRLSAIVLSLPMHPYLSLEQQHHITSTLRETVA